MPAPWKLGELPETTTLLPNHDFMVSVGPGSLGSYKITAVNVFKDAALSGVPTTPTAVFGTNTTQVASCAFVQAALLGSIPDGDKGDISTTTLGTVWIIDPNAVTNTKLNDMPTKTYKGRTLASTGDPQDVPVATLKADLLLTAADIANVPFGNISSTDVQAALNELDAEKMSANAPIIGDTKTKITYGTNGLVLAGVDATTADINDSLNRRYVTDAELVVVGNTSNTNTGDQFLFGSIVVATQTTVTPTSVTTPLTLIAGTSVTITTDNILKTVTINSLSGGGSVTSVSVVSANGFGGSVATPTSTPAITISTSISGLLKGDGTAISAAVSGIDFIAPNTPIVAGANTKISYDTAGLVLSGTAAILASADYTNQGTVSTVLHGNAAGNPSWGAVALGTEVSGTLPVVNGGTNQTTYVNGELLIGNTVGNTLTKATLTEGPGVKVTNGNGSITLSSKMTWCWSASHDGNATVSQYLDRDNAVAVNLSPFVCPVDCTLIYMTAKSDPAGASGSWTAEVYKNGVSVQTLAVTANKATSGLLAVNFVAGDEVALYITRTGINFRNPSINAFFREIL